MGVSTEVLARHTFDRSSHQSLIKDIAHRFQCNVYLIFSSYIDLDDIADNIDRYDVKHYEDHKCYLIDKYIISEDLPNESVTVNYMYNWLLDKLGDKAGELKEIKDTWSDDVDENNDIIRDFASDTKLYDLNFDNFTLEIAVDSILFRSNYTYMKWSTLANILVTNLDYEEGFKLFMKHRIEINKVAKICGAAAVYYYPDNHTHVSFSQGNSWDMTWKAIEESLNSKKVRKHQLILSKLFSDYNYFYSSAKSYERNHKSLTLFKDDFKDLYPQKLIEFKEEYSKPFFQ